MAKLHNPRWAWIVSRVFDPVVEIPILLTFSVMIALTNGLRWRFLVFLLIVDAVVPALFFIAGLKTKKFSDWDLTIRGERSSLYLFTVCIQMFGFMAAYFLGKIFLFKLLFIFWSLALVFAIITLYWKISVHGGVNGALVAFFNHFYGWDRYWWLVLVLFVVLLSRVVIKKHTWAQVLSAAALSIAWVSIGLTLFQVN